MTPTISTKILEKIDFAAFGNGQKIVAFSSPKSGEGVSLISSQLAKRSYDMKKRTLLINLSLPLTGVKVWTIDKSIRQFAKLHPNGFGYIEATGEKKDISIFANSTIFYQRLMEITPLVDRVIIDLPPLLEADELHIAPIPIASVCDNLLIISMAGALYNREATQLMQTLAVAKVKVGGFILNDRDFPTIGTELGRQADKLKNIFPNFSERWSKKFRESDFLNFHS